MKTLATAVMLSMTMAADAQAADLGAEPTRAQAQAELVQAKANGQYTFGEQDYPAAITQGSGRCRPPKSATTWRRPRPPAKSPSATSTTRPRLRTSTAA